MPNFTIASVTVNADGWSADVKLTGQAGQQGNIVYDFGTPGTTGGSNFYFSVTRQGYVAGVLETKASTVYATKAVRKVDPNDADLNEVDSAGDMIVEVSLSQCIYDRDDAAGSGANPRAYIKSGTFTNGADTNVLFDDTASNGSTVVYPKAYGQLRTIPHQKLGATPTFVVTARHKHRISTVTVTVEDESANIASATSSTEVGVELDGSGHWLNVYEVTVDCSALTQGEQWNVGYEIKPIVGNAASVFNSADNADTAANRRLHQCNLNFYGDPDGTAGVTRYVNLDTGSNGNDGSSGSPWATLEHALNSTDDPDLIIIDYTSTDSLTLGAITGRASIGRWKRIEAASGKTVNIVLNGLEQLNTAHVEWGTGIVIQKGAAGVYFYDSTGTRKWWYNGCTFDANGQSATATAPATNYGAEIAYMTGCTMDDAQNWGLQNAHGTLSCAHWFEGNTISSVTTCVISTWMSFCGNVAPNVGLTDFANASQTPQDPAIIESNYFKSFNSAGSSVLIHGQKQAVVVGRSRVGNITEKIAADTNAMVSLSAGATDYANNHCIDWHNTDVGGRTNRLYNAAGASAVYSLGHSEIGVVYDNPNVKTDTFAPANGNRIGNHSVVYGCGSAAVAALRTLGFNTAYPGMFSEGLNAETEIESGTTPCTAAYTDDQSFRGGAAGNGDYLPTDSGDLWQALPAGYAMVPVDLFGNAIPNDGTGHIGAVQSSVPPGGGSSKLLLLWVDFNEDEEQLLEEQAG